MKKLFLSECKKTKGKLFSVLLPVLALIAVWMLWNVHDPKPEILAHGYSYMTSQFTILNVIFLPLTIAVMASRQIDLENTGNTCKLLYTLQTKTSLLHCKLLLSCIYLVLFYLTETGIALLAGKINGFTEAFPFTAYLRLAGTGIPGCLLLYLLQIALSLCLQNQLYPLFIGLIGGFLGLFSLFAKSGSLWMYFCPWSYLKLGFSVNLTIDEATDRLIFFHVPLELTALILLLFAVPAAYLLTRRLFIRKEV